MTNELGRGVRICRPLISLRLRLVLQISGKKEKRWAAAVQVQVGCGARSVNWHRLFQTV
jgi:hypothetical protein